MKKKCILLCAAMFTLSALSFSSVSNGDSTRNSRVVSRTTTVTTNRNVGKNTTKSTSAKKDEAKSLYDNIGLRGKLDYEVFKIAFNGYNKINKKREVLTIIDYSRPSSDQRMFVIDMRNRKLLVETHVSHGRNSGGKMATSFSNRVGSYQSSLGFFKTENTYMGGNGYSLVLNGLEKGINDNAKKRYIVMHGADYANPSFIKTEGRLGRSFGCPAIPRNITKTTIDKINVSFNITSSLFIDATTALSLAYENLTKKSITQASKMKDFVVKYNSVFLPIIFYIFTALILLLSIFCIVSIVS